jgi:hypothetical protein
MSVMSATFGGSKFAARRGPSIFGSAFPSGLDSRSVRVLIATNL